MVHNGIEYADMQLIADTSTVMRCILHMTTEEMAAVWEQWNYSELSSYLVEITAQILRKKDSATGLPMVDVIQDVAGQKGTGKWTGQNALELGIPVPTITEAVFARTMSAQKEGRLALEEIYCSLPGRKTAQEEQTKAPFSPQEKEALLEDLRHTLYGAKICAYAQGFNLLHGAASAYGWKLDMAAIAKIWRGGCIIRAGFLDDVSAAFSEKPGLSNLLSCPFFAEALRSARPGWGRVVALAVEQGIPVVALSSALSYFDAYRTARSNACLLQAQRDYFGAHTYQRVDREGVFHTEWTEA